MVACMGGRGLPDDCNLNGVPDAIEIGEDPSLDCDLSQHVTVTQDEATYDLEPELVSLDQNLLCYLEKNICCEYKSLVRGFDKILPGRQKMITGQKLPDVEKFIANI